MPPRRSLSAVRRKTNWCYGAGFLVCALMLSGTTAYPMGLELREKIFWVTWMFGVVVGVLLLRWLDERSGSRSRMPSARIWSAWRYVGLSVVWGTGIGIVTFSGLVIANGVFARAEPYLAEGVIVAKMQHPTKKGRVSYTIKVRAGEIGELYEYNVNAGEYERTLRGENCPLVLQRGFLGWPFRVK